MVISQADIHKKTLSKFEEERIEAVRHIGQNYNSLPDKEQAWADLHYLISDVDSEIRTEAIGTVNNLVQYCINKDELWVQLEVPLLT